MSYLKDAHARLVGQLANAAPPVLALYPSPDDFEHDMTAHIGAVAAAVNDYLHSVAVELKSHNANVATEDFIAPLADSASDLIGACNDLASAMREDALERAS